MLGELRPNQFGTTAGLWHLNGNSTDSSGNGNNGTDTAITYSLANGKFGQGALFTPASNSSINLGASNTLNLTGDFSINLWAKPTALNSYQIFLRRGSSNGYQFEINNANNTFFFSARGGNTATATTNALTAGVWQMLTMSKSSTNVSFYVNAKFLNTTASITVTSDPGQTAYLGHNGSNTEEYAGDLDEVMVASTALTANQIRTMYALGVGKYY